MIIGISGKKQSGKDTVAKIINYLLTGAENTYVAFDKQTALEGFLKYYDDAKLEDGSYMYPFQNIKFANKLKDMICLLIGCTKEQLEDEEFKNTELGKEWWYFKISQHNGAGSVSVELRDYLTHQEYLEKEMIDSLQEIEAYIEVIKPTPRLLLQLLGTDCGRKIIHPNIWVNSTMINYKKKDLFKVKSHEEEPDSSKAYVYYKGDYPNWIISDVRFPNEVNVIKGKEGITIRINRPKVIRKYFSGAKDDYIDEIFDPNKKQHVDLLLGEAIVHPEHESETALDNYDDWDYIIENNGTIEDVSNKIKEILIKEKLIKS